jgi:hypothetical protein
MKMGAVSKLAQNQTRSVRTTARIAVIAGFLALPLLLRSQQTPAPSSGQQQAGQGAQVHTGMASGIDASARFRNLLANHEYLRMADALDQLTPDQLSPDQAQLYRGLLANRDNDVKKSISLLEPLIEKLSQRSDKTDEKLARIALAEDYLREGNLLQAAKAYEVLSGRFLYTKSGDERYKDRLTPAELDQIEMPLRLLPLAAGNPAMTVDPCEPFSMQVSRNPLGLTEVPVFVDAQPHRWMLDPTMPFNLIARSVAHEVGLKVSDESATIRTLTGKPIEVHMAVIPRITIGGRLTLRNMTAFVFEDKDYSFPASKFTLQGVLGYPAVSALGSLTITANATVRVDPVQVHPAREPDAAKDAAGQPASSSMSGARFFLDGDQLIVALGPTGSERMFALDAAGEQSYLTSRYYEEHEHSFTGKPELFSVPGPSSDTDKLPPQPAYTAETVPLDVGGTVIQAHFLQVLTKPLGDAAIDDVYGVLGIDVLDQLESYTFDYRTMRFRVKDRE